MDYGRTRAGTWHLCFRDALTTKDFDLLGAPVLHAQIHYRLVAANLHRPHQVDTSMILELVLSPGSPPQSRTSAFDPFFRKVNAPISTSPSALFPASDSSYTQARADATFICFLLRVLQNAPLTDFAAAETEASPPHWMCSSPLYKPNLPLSLFHKLGDLIFFVMCASCSPVFGLHLASRFQEPFAVAVVVCVYALDIIVNANFMCEGPDVSCSSPRNVDQPFCLTFHRCLGLVILSTPQIYPVVLSFRTLLLNLHIIIVVASFRVRAPTQHLLARSVKGYVHLMVKFAYFPTSVIVPHGRRSLCLALKPEICSNACAW
ncbi:hypothetical protein K438DRAFT_1780174 [Mycena galopus ATCC 62051]|nr:hypothetical protein K438DRAFT_1780174 [Mycena galopus ATCC 62051]